MNTQKQIFLIVVTFFMFTAGCAAYATIDLPHRAGVQEEYQYEGRVERGALLFANNCRTCHGIKGEGGVGPPLNGSLREQVNLSNFQDQDPLALQGNQALIRRTLECGRAGTLMPAWLKANGGALSRIQIEHLVELLTSPAEDTDPETELPTSKGWLEAEEFAHNLNHESSAVVGGDTLGSIAKGHNIGPKELLAANPNARYQEGETPGINALLKRGSDIRLLPTAQEPNGYKYRIRQDNETIQKIAEAQNVGAVIIADLNGIPYKLDRDSGQMAIFDPETGDERPGLLPGQEIKLPEGATYTVLAGDTIDSIAEQHNISPDQLVDGNEILEQYADDDEINAQQVVKLPEGTKYIAQEGDTLASIAEMHSIEGEQLDEETLRTLNQVPDGEDPQLGAEILLVAEDSDDEVDYTVQDGDTYFSIAEKHGLAADALADFNEFEGDVNEELPTTVELVLPAIDAYVVSGQTLEDVAQGYGNVTVARLAEVNGVEPNSILYIGQQLAIPPESYGSNPPDAINLGTACVEHAVTDAALQQILGLTEPIERPDEASTDVTIEANSNDWIVIADGTPSEPNKGAVLISTGTTVEFTNNVGIHSVTINDEDEVNPFNPGDTFEFTFDEEGEFDITCVFHPAMYAKVYVEDDAGGSSNQ